MNSAFYRTQVKGNAEQNGRDNSERYNSQLSTLRVALSNPPHGHSDESADIKLMQNLTSRIYHPGLQMTDTGVFFGRLLEQGAKTSNLKRLGRLVLFLPALATRPFLIQQALVELEPAFRSLRGRIDFMPFRLAKGLDESVQDHVSEVGSGRVSVQVGGRHYLILSRRPIQEAL